MIEADGLTKYYGTTCAVSDLSFQIPSGETVGFLGLNGAGKSTVLKILAGVTHPTTGTVRIDGHDIVNDPMKVRSRIGFLPEKPPLYDEMTPRGLLTYLGRLRGMSKAQVRKRLPEVMALTALDGVSDKEVGTLSLGYRKRLGIAQAIVHNPSLVILDEPVSGLDPVQVAQMRKLLQALAGDHTVLIATHNLSEVRQTCGHLLVLHGGALMAQGTERELCLGAGGPPAMLLEVRGEPEPVERLLASSPHISSHSRAAVEEGLSRWRIAASEADRGGLMAQLRAQGLEAQWGGEARRTLEEAFLDLVGGTQS